MWEVIRDGAVFALCIAYAGMCLAAVAFWVWRTYVAWRGPLSPKSIGRTGGPAVSLVTPVHLARADAKRRMRRICYRQQSGEFHSGYPIGTGPI